MGRGTKAEDLVRQFAETVVAQDAFLQQGDAKTGNKHARRRFAVFDKLRAMGDSGREALAVLLRDSRPNVRTMAAAYLLRYKTAEALAVLRDASKGRGMIAFESSEAIKRWEEGTWQLDPED
jgi:hypothetical protein